MTTIRPRSLADISALHMDAMVYGIAFVDRDGHRVCPTKVMWKHGAYRDERGLVYKPMPVTLYFDSRDRGYHFEF